MPIVLMLTRKTMKNLVNKITKFYTGLTDRQKQENKQRSSIRYIVERTFGLLKQHHGLAKARYLGLERNKTRAQLIAMSHNLKTGMNIFKQMRSLGDCYAQ
ncbi:hypothetical protein [uncultured Gammaproteobacteria bacterium]|nr:hypothetical protein [uncultured Gammaproteobacteria bacterium]